MTEHINRFKAAVAAICAALTALWGWFGWLVVLWIGSMVLDWITGSAAAMKAGEWASRVAREGIWHKAGAVCAVLVAAMLDLAVGQIIANIPGIELPFTYSVLLCPAVVIWYLLTEAGSIVENAGALGAPVPGWLRKVIAAFRDKLDESAGGQEPG